MQNDDFRSTTKSVDKKRGPPVLSCSNIRDALTSCGAIQRVVILPCCISIDKSKGISKLASSLVDVECKKGHVPTHVAIQFKTIDSIALVLRAGGIQQQIVLAPDPENCISYPYSEISIPLPILHSPMYSFRLQYYRPSQHESPCPVEVFWQSGLAVLPDLAAAYIYSQKKSQPKKTNNQGKVSPRYLIARAFFRSSTGGNGKILAYEPTLLPAQEMVSPLILMIASQEVIDFLSSPSSLPSFLFLLFSMEIKKENI